MTIHAKGILKGRLIELDHPLDLPEGSKVSVTIEQPELSLDEKRQAIRRATGAWADDPTIKAVFEEIERERAAERPREIDFDAAS